MKIKAKRSFCGAFSMAAGETRVCDDPVLVADLLRAGYAVVVDSPAEAKAPAKSSAPAAPEKKTVKRKAAKKEG